MAIRRVTGAGVGLVVGIIILALLVWWGLWAVQQRGEQAREQEAVKIAEEQLEAESNEGVALNPEEGSGSEGSNSGSNNSGSGGSTSNNGSTNGSTGGSTNGSTNGSSNSSELPQTGPAEFVSSLVVLAVISFTVTSYLKSRSYLQ